MRLNVTKCGLMRFGDDEPLRPSASKTVCWVMQGEPLPVLRVYKYLGLAIDWNLSYDTICRFRLEMAWKTARALTYVLSTSSISAYVRLLAAWAALLPQLLYGSEVTALSKDRFKPTQTLLGRCLWLSGGHNLANCGYSLGVRNSALYRDLGMAPVHALAVAPRCRLLRKARLLRSGLIFGLLLPIGVVLQWESDRHSLSDFVQGLVLGPCAPGLLLGASPSKVTTL